jgi:hypothetical protein
MITRHHPNGDGSMHCDSGAIEASLRDYQSTGSTAALDKFLAMAQERALTLIRYNHVTRYRTETELMSDITFKLIRSAPRFDSSRGSGFTFLSAVVMNVLRTNVTSARKHLGRFTELDESVLGEIAIDSGRRSREAIEDFTSKLRHGVRSVLTDESELATQRWYIDSFCNEDFASPRHSCANSCMRAYGVSRARSRELYDLTMAEARRILYGELKDRRTIFPGQLSGTRCAWMTSYAPLLSRDEFTKFAVIMRGLAPYLLLLIVDPGHENNHRRDRNPTVGRRNLELILYGSPAARLLFDPKT